MASNQKGLRGPRASSSYWWRISTCAHTPPINRRLGSPHGKLGRDVEILVAEIDTLSLQYVVVLSDVANFYLVNEGVALLFLDQLPALCWLLPGRTKLSRERVVDDTKMPASMAAGICRWRNTFRADIRARRNWHVLFRTHFRFFRDEVFADNLARKRCFRGQPLDQEHHS